MKKVEITCDHCGDDITYTSHEFQQRIVVENQRMPLYPDSSTCTAMRSYSGLEQTRHFCDLGCLFAWAESNRTAP